MTRLVGQDVRIVNGSVGGLALGGIITLFQLHSMQPCLIDPSAERFFQLEDASFGYSIGFMITRPLEDAGAIVDRRVRRLASLWPV